MQAERTRITSFGATTPHWCLTVVPLSPLLSCLKQHYRIASAPSVALTPGVAWLVARVAPEGTRFASFPLP